MRFSQSTASHFLASLTMGLILSFGSTANVEARTLNYATPAPPTQDRPSNQVLRWWADEVEARTNGSITIKIHWLQSLLKYADGAQGVSAGVADIAPINPDYTAAKFPLWALSANNVGPGDPYIAAEAWRRVAENSEALKQEAIANNMKYLAHYSSGPFVFMSTTRPYLIPGDFAGDKLRMNVRTVRAAQLEDWPVTPVNVAFSEIYSAMERGTIDGAQSHLSLIPPYKHNEVADHVVETGIGQVGLLIMMNKNIWESLTPEEQKVFEEISPELIERWAQAAKQEADDARTMMQNDSQYPVEVHTLSDEQRRSWEDALRKADEEHLERVSRRSPDAKEIYQRFSEELTEVEKEVQSKGYPWDKE